MYVMSRVIYLREVAREEAECKIFALLDKPECQGTPPVLHVILGFKNCILELQKQHHFSRNCSLGSILAFLSRLDIPRNYHKD